MNLGPEPTRVSVSGGFVWQHVSDVRLLTIISHSPTNQLTPIVGYCHIVRSIEKAARGTALHKYSAVVRLDDSILEEPLCKVDTNISVKVLESFVNLAPIINHLGDVVPTVKILLNLEVHQTGRGCD
jgi:hypothetical protein